MRKIGKSAACAAKCLYAAMEYLKSKGDGAPVREITQYLEKKVSFTDWEKERSGKFNTIRWVSNYQFYSIDYVRAGFIEKNSGLWFITPDGEKALKLKPEEVLDRASTAYKEWYANNHTKKEKEVDKNQEADNNDNISFQDLKSQALSEIKTHIQNMDPIEFQELVAALLRAMGYYTPFVSTKGKDGGVDVIAYSDPLGLKQPTLKVQVKRYNDNNSVSAHEVRGLIGILNPDEVALFVTSGYYSPDAKKAAKDKKIRLVDGNEFITLWQEFYEKMNDEDKDLLPLRHISFLDKND